MSIMESFRSTESALCRACGNEHREYLSPAWKHRLEMGNGGEMRNPSQNCPVRGSRPSLNKAWECHGRMAAVCITLLLLGPRQQDSGFERCCFPQLPL